MPFARSTWLLDLGWATETFDGDASVFAEVPKMMTSECSSKVGDNVVQETKYVDDIFKELDQNKQLVFDPL